MSSQPDVIDSAAKFLQTPANPERPLEDKIRFLIKEKNLSQYQLISALKKANLYSMDTIEPILKMCYFENHQHKLSKNNKRKKQKSKSQSQNIQTHQTPSVSSSSLSPWWSTLSTVGVGVASFIASYTASTTASQNLVKKSETKTISKLESIKTEIKEQADLDRERQHRDLMEVVSLLKTQVQCVQQNLGVLKQSIDVIQTQMKFNQNSNINMNDSMEQTNTTNNGKYRNNIGRSDDGSITSSNMSTTNDQKQQNNHLGVIGNLLAQNDDGLDWLNSDISINANEQSTENTKNEKEKEEKSENEELDLSDIEIIYRLDYKEMIETLPTNVSEIKQQLIDLLDFWQCKVAKNDETALTVKQIKNGFNALNFYISKILKKPFFAQFRSINTYNKQYKERLSTLPKIESLLGLIGYEKKKVFWVLPLLCSDDEEDKEKEGMHERQIEFLKALKEVLANLFNFEGSLPSALTEKIMKIKQEKEDMNIKKKEEEIVIDDKESKEQLPAMEKIKVTESENVTPPQTKYSNKFQEIAQIVAAGGKPDDVQVIDDMPPDPNADPSPSKLEQKTKPFEQNIKENKDEKVQNGMSWFEQYEQSQQKEQNDA